MPELKVYRGFRKPDGEAMVSVNGVPLTHIVLHSPGGFEWGYGGSGPADTALSILSDYFDERPTKDDLYHGLFRASRLYQDFKWGWIATADHNDWEITSSQIDAFMRSHSIQLQENDEHIAEYRAMRKEAELEATEN